MKASRHDWEQYVNEYEQVFHWQGTTSAGHIRAIMLDLSDTTNYKHTDTSRLDVTRVEMRVKATTAAGSATLILDMGLVKRVAGTGCSLYQMVTNRFNNVLANWQGTIFEMDGRQIPGTAGDFLCAGDAGAAGSAFVADTGSNYTVPVGAAGTAQPAVGDIYLLLTDLTQGTVTYDVKAWYHSH